MSTILSSQSLSIGYPGKTVASNLDLRLTKGRLVCLLGPNGAGKSTLMRTLCAMQTPIAGQVLLNGVDIHTISSRELARLLSVVLTDRVQVGLLSAYELVSLGRYPYTGWNGRLSDDDHRIIRESIEATGAQDLAARPVDELSDGERQKVLMARALAQQPQLLILDEVTAFLAQAPRTASRAAGPLGPPGHVAPTGGIRTTTRRTTSHSATSMSFPSAGDAGSYRKPPGSRKRSPAVGRHRDCSSGALANG